MTKNNPMDAMNTVVEALTPLPSDERMRVIKAAMVMLGEEAPQLSQSSAEKPVNDEAVPVTGLGHRAKAWMKQNSVTDAALQEVFHVTDEGAEVIAANIPGKSKKEQTYNAYVLTGIRELLSTGTPSFQDKAARALCERLGCYDQANHAAFIKSRGNLFTGTKEKGWTLTVPGLLRGAGLIKEVNSRA